MGLSTKTIQRASLALQSVHNVHGGHRLAFSVLGVRHSVANNVLEKHLQHSASLFIDKTRNTLHATTTRQTANGGLRNTLDVISQNFPMAFGATFPKSLTAFSSTGHDKAAPIRLKGCWKNAEQCNGKDSHPAMERIKVGYTVCIVITEHCTKANHRQNQREEQKPGMDQLPWEFIVTPSLRNTIHYGRWTFPEPSVSLSLYRSRSTRTHHAVLLQERLAMSEVFDLGVVGILLVLLFIILIDNANDKGQHCDQWHKNNEGSISLKSVLGMSPGQIYLASNNLYDIQ
ncbi:hypothetical protein DNTS_023693 [Danionella cerebrum]|uniref:Uncharacterized protein n=1 Tax=Danionella cerebrum TaxID=2873325 RepID=A0A553MML8_9TELE|nr:hypothetical protein DNTS_023693 [Danionella translucida]